MFAVVSQITKRRQTFHNSCRTGAASSGRIRNNSVQIWRAVRYEVKRFCTELKFPPPPPLLKYVFFYPDICISKWILRTPWRSKA